MIQLQDIYKEIEADQGIQNTIQKVRARSLLNDNYQVLEGRLWYKRRLVVPKTSFFIPLILHEAHDSLG